MAYNHLPYLFEMLLEVLVSKELSIRTKSITNES
jgi:hypothetical protein